MMTSVSIMLYVEDVSSSADFWQTYLEFAISAELDLGDSTSIVLGNDQGFTLQLFEQTFIKRVSPEVSLATPSLLFQTDNIEKAHQKIQASPFFTSEISRRGEHLSFNFADNEGRYFAIAQM